MKEKTRRVLVLFAIICFLLVFFISFFIEAYYLYLEHYTIEEIIGEIRKDNWNKDRLYCDEYISTGWVYTFNEVVPQEELNKICEMEVERRKRK